MTEAEARLKMAQLLFNLASIQEDAVLHDQQYGLGIFPEGSMDLAELLRQESREMKRLATLDMESAAGAASTPKFVEVHS